MTAILETATFWALVKKTEQCWLWQGAVNSKGYPTFKGGVKKAYAHRLAYQNLVGPIPEGFTIDHLCKEKLCINPKHLEAVTDDENRKRAMARKLYCGNGHLLHGENLSYYPKGVRRCRQCNIEANRRYHRVEMNLQFGMYWLLDIPRVRLSPIRNLTAEEREAVFKKRDENRKMFYNPHTGKLQDRKHPANHFLPERHGRQVEAGSVRGEPL